MSLRRLDNAVDVYEKRTGISVAWTKLEFFGEYSFREGIMELVHVRKTRDRLILQLCIYA